MSSRPPAVLSRVLRALLACVFVVGGMVLAVQAPASACTCQPADAERQTSRADAVFIGTVDGVTRADQQLEMAVTATRVYKGTVERSTTVTTARQTTACGIGVPTPGADYLFIVRGDAPPYLATSCDGTGRVDADRVAQVEGILGTGQAVLPPPPPTATLTRVEESAPASLARLAAPGGALLILSLLTLVVVARRDRRG
ncbi:hypothetical protein [Nocardioides sp. P5_C9_2]